MADLWARDGWLVLLMAVSAVLMLAVQLILCFRVKNPVIRLLPAVLSAGAAAVFYILMLTARDWSALIYVIAAVYCGVLLLSSGIGWGIRAAAELFGRKKGTE